jgi:DNA replication protein DnaC
MFDKATINKLREMKLSTMAAKFAWQQEQPDVQTLSFEERFGMIVDAEWMAKHDRRIDRFIKQAQFRFPAAIEDIDFHEKRGITKPDVLRLSDCLYIQKKQNLIISGPTGVGKTYLACALGRCACRLGIAVMYIRISDLFLSISEAHATSSYASFRKRPISVPLLILDDWGIKPFSMVECHEMSELVEMRYGRASTVVLSQLPHTSWHELFPDPTQADAVLDRLVHNAFKYNLTGESMRKTLALRQFDEDLIDAAI